jgi:hypothetical protein
MVTVEKRMRRRCEGGKVPSCSCCFSLVDRYYTIFQTARTCRHIVFLVVRQPYLHTHPRCKRRSYDIDAEEVNGQPKPLTITSSSSPPVPFA